MNYPRLFCLALAATVAVPFAHSADSGPDPGQICISVGRLLEQGHYSRRKLDDEMSKQFLKNYLEALDYNHIYFTQQDVDAFNDKYASALDDDILLGNPAPATDIFDIYKKRVKARIAKVKDLVNEKFDFNTQKTVTRDRSKAPWPKDDAEADQIWHDLVMGEVLQEKLNTSTKSDKVAKADSKAKDSEKKSKKDTTDNADKVTLNQHEGEIPSASATPIDKTPDSPAKIIVHRYDQVLKNIDEQTPNDVVSFFLTTLAQTYDPHSEYFNKDEYKNFNIQMGLSLFGIGAQLRMDDGYVKVTDLITGGPAQTDGRLKVNDRIVGVAQGNTAFTDVMGMKLDKVVDLIRGKKGTTVRLQVIPGRATDPSVRKVVDLVRDEVKLKDQQASAKIIERPDDNGGTQKLGWIILPSFYADMENPGAKGAASTTADVKALVERLKKENVSGIVMDLRRNGGGSLEEAIHLTGVFIKKPMVVQTKDGNGNIQPSMDRDASDFAYDGPLLVLTNRLSASASEIFTAALQDYGRAVVVGDQSTFGKGTVQTMLEIGRFIPFLGGDSSDAGALKLTIQKFYRISGGSTQLHGVTSDIHLPSIYDHPEIGERSLKGPMPYDEIPPAKYQKIADHPLFLKELAARSAARVATDPEFHYIEQDLATLEKKISDNVISLNEKTRRDEINADKTRLDKRTADREHRKPPVEKVVAVTVDTASSPTLQVVTNTLDPKPAPNGAANGNAKVGQKIAAAETPSGDTADDSDDEDDDAGDSDKEPKIDPIRNETLNILGDLIELSRTVKTASVK
ncbi:MAG: carboxy terminal-processing peptidase [Chthoniobacteraceae bacterium]